MGRIVDVVLDPKSIQTLNHDIEQEQRSAIYDLLNENSFTLIGVEDDLLDTEEPYGLKLSIIEKRLVISIRKENCQGNELIVHILSLTPFRRIIRDYFMVCDSYYSAIKSLSPSQIEAIDMGRRGLHNDGGELLQERLKDKVEMDFQTARRLFTLLCALHWKG